MLTREFWKVKSLQLTNCFQMYNLFTNTSFTKLTWHYILYTFCYLLHLIFIIHNLNSIILEVLDINVSVNTWIVHKSQAVYLYCLIAEMVWRTRSLRKLEGHSEEWKWKTSPEKEFLLPLYKRKGQKDRWGSKLRTCPSRVLHLWRRSWSSLHVCVCVHAHECIRAYTSYLLEKTGHRYFFWKIS